MAKGEGERERKRGTERAEEIEINNGPLLFLWTPPAQHGSIRNTRQMFL